MKTVFVGMSGGVDSSVAALLLKEQGYHVEGVTMRLFGERLPNSDDGGIEDARRVCEALGIPHHIADLHDLFCRTVVDDFATEYQQGRTPNPCINCNCFLKFGGMWEWAKAHGADAIATGHYTVCRQDPASGRYEIYRTPSPKDQSYMLWRLSQEQLAVSLFPLAGMEKAAVRELARGAALPVADKGDSMEICFVENDGHTAFIEQYTGQKAPAGDFIDQNGTVLGRHGGITRYTVGQRKGLGIALGEPMYVNALDAARNAVVLGPEGSQYKNSLAADHLNFVSVTPPEKPIRAFVKIRYQAKPAAATVTVQGDTAEFIFDEPQRSVTPGQSAVAYDEQNRLLFGGLIR